MLKNYFIAAIRAIRRSPWEAMLRIFAIAAGVCTSVLHFAFWFSGGFSNFPELITGITLVILTSILLIQFYGQPRDNREYRLRIILGDEDLLMRGRKIVDAGLIILGGVILGLVCADSYLTYTKSISPPFSETSYMVGVLILGFVHFTIFLFTVWFGTAIVIKDESESFSKFSKLVAGFLIFITTLAAIAWTVVPSDHNSVFEIYYFDIIAISCFSFASWNRLAQYILSSKGRVLSIMKMQGASNLRLIIYWFIQLGPAALISIGSSVLAGNVYLFFEMPFRNDDLIALITACWGIFVFVIVVLGLIHPVFRGFQQETTRTCSIKI